MGSWRSTHPTETTFVDLLRVEEMQRADWMICLVWIQDGGICYVDEKWPRKAKFVSQSRPALYFSQQLSSARKKSFCRATN